LGRGGVGGVLVLSRGFGVTTVRKVKEMNETQGEK